MRPSTEHPNALPDVQTLRRLTQSLAMLDAVLCPEWQYRYYSFNSRWGLGEQMASMRDGCGDDWFLLFDPDGGAALKGYAHESPLAGGNEFAASIPRHVPPAFSRFLKEPAFSMDRATFCLWRLHDDVGWHVVPSGFRASGAAGDGSAELIGILDNEPATYQSWARDYYERDVSLEGVRLIYERQPLNKELITALNLEAIWEEVMADALEIGYPSTAS